MKITRILQDICDVFVNEVRRIFTNKMVMLVFFVATALYPIVFCLIYYNELVVETPVAVVDNSNGVYSRRFIHKIDATAEVNVAFRCSNMSEAKQLMKDEKIHAIYYFPRDFDTRLNNFETGRVAMFCDMSSFLYYKNAMLAGNNVLIDEMHTIELERYNMSGLNGEQAQDMLQPIVYDDVKLYNPAGGFASFFIPALLMLVIHQTLFFGICILCGDANENKRALLSIPPRLRNRSIHRVTIGRSLCYILIYVPIVLFDLWLIPRWFGMPQLGRFDTMIGFVLPVILSVTFFAMTFGNIFVREKMSGVLSCLFFSVMLFFLSGVVWPQSNMPKFWLVLSYIFPSTPAIEGFVRITSTGAMLAEVKYEYLVLWIQACVYFFTACESLRFIKRFKKT